MSAQPIDAAVASLEKANAELCPEVLTADEARRLLESYVQAQRLAQFGVASLSRKLQDAASLAKATGTSLGKAREVVATGKVLAESEELSGALQKGDISLEQAGEIAAAEESSPGAAKELLEVAKKEPFHVLKDKARQAKLQAEQHRDLGSRQHAARSARSYVGALGMVEIHLCLEPHIGAPITVRAEAEAARLAHKAKAASGNKEGGSPSDAGEERAREPFERYLADAYAALLSGTGKGPAKRPELVVLLSHEVATRGWSEVRPGEVCKIPGYGPVTPETAKTIANDAFLSGVFYDGKDLRHFVRWSRNIPVEVRIALELGEPPKFEGVRCVDCGNRSGIEIDHVQPWSRRGPTSKPNLQPRCWTCITRRPNGI